MSYVVEIIDAMGFWGWMAVIACTAIICEAVVSIKKLELKRREKERR